ncbi:5-methylaminomethyl-2-thiouridylate-methyltransferase [Neoconidiobolus thromboides FSU 785]|nr:5-methylaminomethyl-2-thiouridylate-methyltransferase [Neoconidiobolus thromboides FSU 785]
MSGGVDSTVTAYLLKEKGLNVQGIYMQNWDVKEEGSLDSSCEKEWEKLNFIKDYWNFVFEKMIFEYSIGLTPNPDIICNNFIKFDSLIQRLNIQQHNNIWLATGHYAQLKYNQSNNKYQLFQAIDPVKDQTYYLSNLKQYQFKNVLFPLGCYYKTEVKQIAKKIGLTSISEQAESMGICFIGKKKKFNEFLSNYISNNPGKIITTENEFIDYHDGIWSYTIGQRLRLSFKSKKYYIISKDIENNLLIVAPDRNHPKLYQSELILPSIDWILEEIPEELKSKLSLIL